MRSSLQRRFLIWLLLPVTIVLGSTGVASFIYARSYLLDQWTKTARLRLERVAHEIEMRLDGKRELMDLVARAEETPDSRVTQMFLVQRLADEPGVSFVAIDKVSAASSQARNGIRNAHKTKPRPNDRPGRGPDMKTAPLYCPPSRESSSRNERPPMHRPMHNVPHGDLRGRHMPMRTRSGSPGDQDPWSMGRHMVRPPCNVAISLDHTGNFLSMVETFPSRDNAGHKRIEVRVLFDSFMRDILDAGQWELSYACLINRSGDYLAHTNPAMENLQRMGETGDPIEQKVLESIKSNDWGTIPGAGHPPDWVAGFYRVPTTDWFLVLFARGEVVLAPIVRFRANYVLGGILSLILTAALIRFNTQRVVRAISRISKAADRVEEGDYSVEVQTNRQDEIGRLAARFNNMVAGLRRRKLIEDTFGRYVDPTVAHELMNRPDALQLGGEKAVVTIMMADLRGFTAAAERLAPEAVVAMLNEHFGHMIEIIDQHRGIIVDFFGDSVLVFFNGLSSDARERALDAIRCGLAMQVEHTELAWRQQTPEASLLSMGIGIHTGEVIVGNIGSRKRAKYGIVGSPVNETHRIQSFAEGGTVIISEQTHQLVGPWITVGPKCTACLKGLEGEKDLYPVISVDEQVRSGTDS